MHFTRAVSRTPLIKFIGKRKIPDPSTLDHSLHRFSQDPHPDLPESFKAFRNASQSHGPSKNTSSNNYSAASGDEVNHRYELPNRFQYIEVDPKEIDIINSGGASGF